MIATPNGKGETLQLTHVGTWYYFKGFASNPTDFQLPDVADLEQGNLFSYSL